MEKPVDEHGAGFLVNLILQRMATQRHFDDNVEFPRGFFPTGILLKSKTFFPLFAGALQNVGAGCILEHWELAVAGRAGDDLGPTLAGEPAAPVRPP